MFHAHSFAGRLIFRFSFRTHTVAGSDYVCCAGSGLFRQRRDLKICTNGFIVSAGGSPATLFTAKLCNIGDTGHKALLCQNGRTVCIFQDGKTALCPHFGVAGLDQLLCFSYIINVTDSPRPRRLAPAERMALARRFAK